MDAEAQSGRTSALASLDESGVVVRQIPAEVSYPGRTRAAILGRRIVPLANVPLSVAGGRWLDERWLGVVAAITGGPAFLVDPSGAVVVRAGFPTAGDADIAPPGAAGAEPPTKGERGRVDGVSGEIPVGEGWRVRVTAPAADVGRARRELGAIALGIAPFALATALVLGIVLAQGITRPL